MDDNVDILYGSVEGARGSEVSSDGHGEQVSVLFASGFHFVCLGRRPCCPGDLYPAFKEEVYDVGTHVACSTCDENMAKRLIRNYPMLG